MDLFFNTYCCERPPRDKTRTRNIVGCCGDDYGASARGGGDADQAIDKAEGASVFDAPTYRCDAVTTALDEDGAAVLCAFDDGALGAWIWRSSHPLEAIWSRGQRHTEVSCISLAPDCGLGRSDSLSLAVGCKNGHVVEYELDGAHCGFVPKCSWQAHFASPAVGAAFSGVVGLALDGSGFATGGSDGDAHIWGRAAKADQVEARRRIHGAHGGAVTAVALAADRFVSGGEDGAVRLWSPQGDVTLPKHGRDLSLAELGMVRSVALDVKYNRLCTGSEDGFVRLWDIGAGRATWRVFHPTHRKAGEASPGPENGFADDPRHGVQAIAVDRGGVLTQLVSAGSDGSVRLWDVREPKPVEHLAAHSRPVSSVAVHGERMLSASLDGAAILWDIRSPASPVETVDLLGPRPRGMQAAPSPRGRSGGRDAHDFPTPRSADPPSDPVLFRGPNGSKEQRVDEAAACVAPASALPVDAPPTAAVTPRSAAHGWNPRSWARR